MRKYIKHKDIVIWEFLIAIVLLTSCKRNESNFKIDNLKGTWALSSMNYTFLGDTSIRSANSMEMFSFLSIDDSSKCSYYDFRQIDCEQYFNLIGSKYIIKNDTLNIYHKRKELWYDFKLLSLNQDTLTILNLDTHLFNGRDTIQFIKEHKKSNNFTLDFDEIFIETSRMKCNSTLHVLDKNGTLQIFKNEGNSKGLSHLTYEISTRLSDSLFNNFKYVDFKNLASKNYSTINADNILIFNIYFIKGGKVVKMIEDYHMAAPLEFSISYLSIIGLDVNKKVLIANKKNSATESLVKKIFNYDTLGSVIQTKSFEN